MSSQSNLYSMRVCAYHSCFIWFQVINRFKLTVQEKTEAEIRQFRRSLNFKATPMPSFYHDAVSPAPDGNKVRKKLSYNSAFLSLLQMVVIYGIMMPSGNQILLSLTNRQIIIN